MNPLRLTAPLVASLLSIASAQAGVVVANHDTATLNVASAGVAAFSRNLVQFLDRDGTVGGQVLVFNREESLGNPARIKDTFFAAAIAPLGYTVVAASRATTTFTLDTLQAFDAVLLAGRVVNSLGEDIKDDQVLADYVAGGGGVYIAAGAGGFAPDAQAAYWNSFLDDFGIAYEPTFNNRVGVDLVTGGEGPLFAGVVSLSAGNGQDLRLHDPRDPDAVLVQRVPGATMRGLTAVHLDAAPVAVSAPTSVLLAGLGLVGLGVGHWRRPSDRSPQRGAHGPRAGAQR